MSEYVERYASTVAARDRHNLRYGAPRMYRSRNPDVSGVLMPQSRSPRRQAGLRVSRQNANTGLLIVTALKERAATPQFPLSHRRDHKTRDVVLAWHGPTEMASQAIGEASESSSDHLLMYSNIPLDGLARVSKIGARKVLEIAKNDRSITCVRLAVVNMQNPWPETGQRVSSGSSGIVEVRIPMKVAHSPP